MTFSDDPVLRKIGKLQQTGLPLPDVITQSWRRCLTDYNLTPDRIPKAEALGQAELRDLMEQRAELLRIAAPEVDRLFLRLTGQEYLVSLAGSEGAMLLYRSDYNRLSELARSGVVPGSVWREDLQGTNGIGTGLRLGRSVIIEGAQHYGSSTRSLTCVTAPVWGSGGALEGILNVTTPRAVHDSPMNLIIQDIVCRAARRIETGLFLRTHRSSYTLRISRAETPPDLAEDGYLALSPSGAVLDLTSRSESLLGTSREQLLRSTLKDLLGTNVLTAGQPLRLTLNGLGLHLLLLLPEGSPQSPAPLPSKPRPALVLLPADEQLLNHAQKLATAGLPLLLSGESGSRKTSLGLYLAGREATLINAKLPEANEALQRALTTPSKPLLIEHADHLTDEGQHRLIALMDQACPERRLLLTTSQPSLPPALNLRFSQSRVELPPLRARADLVSLIKHVFAQIAQDRARILPEPLLHLLAKYHWPGNFHHLVGALSHAVALAAGPQVQASDFPPEIAQLFAQSPRHTVSEIASAKLKSALQFPGGNVSVTARYLGISRATLYRRLSEIERKALRKT